MKEEIIYQRNFTAERNRIHDNLCKDIAEIQDDPELHNKFTRLLDQFDRAHYIFDKSLAKTAGRMVGEAIPLAVDLNWDIIVTRNPTTLTVTLTPTCLLDLSILSNMICHADTFGIDNSDTNNLKLRFTYPTHKLNWE